MERKAEVPETVVHATSETRKPIAADSKVKSTGQAARQQKPNNGADSQSYCEEFGGQPPTEAITSGFTYLCFSLCFVQLWMPWRTNRQKRASRYKIKKKLLSTLFKIVTDLAFVVLRDSEILRLK